MNDMGDRPPDTLSTTKIYPAVIDVMDATQTTPGKVQPGLLPDVPARVLPRAFRGPGHVRDLQVFDPDHVEPPHDAGAGLLRPVRAPVRLPGPQPGDRVLDPAAALRSPPGAGEPALQPPQPGPLPPGQAGGSAAARRWTGLRRPPRPGRCPRPGRYPVPGPARGSRRRRHASGPRGPSSPGRTSRPAARRGTSGTAPTRPWAPRPRPFPANPAHIPLPPAPDDPESLIPPGLAPRRPPGRVARVEERRHRLGEVAQRLLLHRLGAGGQPRVLRPRLR